MMRTLCQAWVVALAVFFALLNSFVTAQTSPVRASDSATTLIVEVEWLAQHINDRNLVVLYVGDPQAYATGHIPGARQLTMNDLAHPPGGANDLTLELPDPGVARAKLMTLGVSDDSRIVVYGNDVPNVTRVIFTLDYLGLGGQTSFLNGFLPAWKRAGQPAVTEATKITPGTLTPRPTKSVAVDATVVQGIRERANYKLVDARAPVFYNGTQPTGNNVFGHIPGAVNIPFTDISDSAQMIDRARIEKLFRDAGIRPGETVVAYCHIGMQGTAVVLGARLIGQPVMLYDGSFQDWATRNRGPVEK